MSCGSIFYHNSEVFRDTDGCILKDGHDGPHVCLVDEKYYKWIPEYCGCEGCRSEDCSDMCVIIWETVKP